MKKGCGEIVTLDSPTIIRPLDPIVKSIDSENHRLVLKLNIRTKLQLGLGLVIISSRFFKNFYLQLKCFQSSSELEGSS